MKVRVPIIVKDPKVTQFKEVSPIEWVIIEEEFFLDGPISPRVAVLDFDEPAGVLLPGAPFLPPERTAGLGGYRIMNENDLCARDFIQVSVFGTVYKALEMFEEPDALGRRIRWAFDGPQLLVVPRAGLWENAFYQRDSRSLQLFFFKADHGAGAMVYSSQSQDIITHETTHAILDGIAPDLYDATLPESLALHEAVADIASVLTAFRSRELARTVLAQTGGSIERSSVFNGLAEQFAGGLGQGRLFLRDLLNHTRYRDVDSTEPHSLSQVLSGALYLTVVKLHDSLRDQFGRTGVPSEDLMAPWEVQGMTQASAQGAGASQELSQTLGQPLTPLVASEKALWIAANRLKRLLFRGLDYLPPGEASFADLGRAMMAADTAYHPESDQQREWLCQEFKERGMVADSSELVVPVNFEERAVLRLDLQEFMASDWLAYDFANRNRNFLRIPKKVPFQVHPRLAVEKKYYHRDGPRKVRECLFKVSWTETEPNEKGGGLPASRRVTSGTSLAIDWQTKQVRALLTLGKSDALRVQRDGFLKRLVDEDLLRTNDRAAGLLGRPRQSYARAETPGGVLRVRGTASMMALNRV